MTGNNSKICKEKKVESLKLLHEDLMTVFVDLGQFHLKRWMSSKNTHYLVHKLYGDMLRVFLLFYYV